MLISIVSQPRFLLDYNFLEECKKQREVAIGTKKALFLLKYKQNALITDDLQCVSRKGYGNFGTADFE